MKLSLVVMTPGKQEGKVLPIGLQQFLIGRDPQCHLRPASAAISKRHCALIQRDGKIFVRDFDSTNGTFLNDQPIKGEVEVHHDDRLRVGPLLFVVQVEASAPVNKPTPAPPSKKPAVAPAKTTAAATTKPAAGEGKGPSDKTPSPAPAKAPAAAAAGGSADEDIAAMLLSLQDDDNPSSPLGGGEVPEGSTVMEMIVPPEPGGEGKPKEEEKPKPSLSANTSSAAKAILEKYMRRPR